ncbi:hypothetical protein JXA47_12490 [Candidatus Sumerlaeota bacterium]|nr:hypothetical protein [Candidatus Sumerlaeota bacterium]
MAWRFYAFPLVFTLVIELPLATELVPRGQRRRTLLDAFLINIFTNPLAVFFHRLLATPGIPYGLPFLLIEIVVILTEALLYRSVTRLPWGRAALVSSACNVASAGIGVVYHLMT